MDKALPRSVNGYPMFGSFHMMHRKDWEIVLPSIKREKERRESDIDLIDPNALADNENEEEGDKE